MKYILSKDQSMVKTLSTNVSNNKVSTVSFIVVLINKIRRVFPLKEKRIKKV